MIFIGDVHGKIKEYFHLLRNLNQKSIQVGDFGFGFVEVPESWSKNHKFIRGNHDDPACVKHPNCLGDYGLTEDKIFFVGGAYSIDAVWRKAQQYKYKNPIWWENEEIPEKEFKKILDLYDKEKPDIVVSHDCPAEIRKLIIDGPQYRNRTSDGLLSAMFYEHAPKLWVFGHYHKSFDQMIKGTRFICLNELEVFDSNYELV